MPSLRIFRTESFRLATLFAVLVLCLTAVLMTVTYWIVERTQTATLIDAVDADIATINNGMREKGLEEAIEIVQQRLGPPDDRRGNSPGDYILLQDAAGLRLAGNLPMMPVRLGVFGQPAPHSGRQHSRSMLGRGEMLTAGVYLYVARDTASITAVRARLLTAFLSITGAVLLLAVAGGMFFSIQFLRRIDAIARTCDAIVKGHLGNRIPLRGSDDELDRLAASINSMLDRMAALMENIRQVSSDVAHDLRTPLTHLRQRLEAAHVRASSMADYSDAVSQAIADTDELLAIFAALLRISQIESGSRRTAFTALSLSDLLQKVCDLYLPVAEDQGQMLERDVETGASIHGDPELLTQMFINLIENAIRHSPRGTAIKVSLRRRGRRLQAIVADTGPGIAPDERGKVFQRFYRGAASRSTPGNGLGLALVAAIANLHQASIELADNHPGLRVIFEMDCAAG
ncbi:MAG: ATP-binding protein [Steroidobacteraceae bacterium]